MSRSVPVGGCFCFFFRFQFCPSCSQTVITADIKTSCEQSKQATVSLDSLTVHPDHLPCGILSLVREASREYCVSSQFPCHKEFMSVCASIILHACLRPLPSCCSRHERICSRRIHVLNVRNIFVTTKGHSPHLSLQLLQKPFSQLKE